MHGTNSCLFVHVEPLEKMTHLNSFAKSSDIWESKMEYFQIYNTQTSNLVRIKLMSNIGT